MESITVRILGLFAIAIVMTLMQGFMLAAYGKRCPEYGILTGRKIIGLFFYDVSVLACGRVALLAQNGNVIEVLALAGLTVFLGVITCMDGVAAHFEMSILVFSLAYLLVMVIVGLCFGKTLAIHENAPRYLLYVAVVIVLSLFAFAPADGVLILENFWVMVLINPQYAFLGAVFSLVMAFVIAAVLGIPYAIKKRSFKIKIPFAPCIAGGFLPGYFIVVYALVG